MPVSARERFAQLVSNVSEDFDLAEAALLIAQDAQPDRDVMAYLQRFEALAATVRTRLPEKPDTATIIDQLNELLFHEEKLSVANHRLTQREDMRDLERVTGQDQRIGVAAPFQSSLSIELQNARGIRDRERRHAFEREAVFGHERAHQTASIG